MTTPPSRAEGGAPRPSIEPMRLLTAIGSPIALATTLALYFGWVRSRAQAAAFGADVSVFDMSPQDLVLRSVDVLFLPIRLALLIGLGLVRLEPWLQEHAEPVGRVLWFSWLLVPLALVLLAVQPDVGYNLLPLFAMGAIAGMAYGSVLDGMPGATQARPGSPTWRSSVRCSSPPCSGRPNASHESAARPWPTTSARTSASGSRP